jgi:drug/metabolite transporter (DMT)-like permease
MFPSFITTIFFSLSAIFASRSSRLLGAATANLGRLCISLFLLGIWAHTKGEGIRGTSFSWFFLSGLIGYGLGDVALFLALARIGPRLTMLIVHCLAVPIAAVLENLWLGTTLRPVEIVCVGVILSGVVLALTPVRHFNLTGGVFWSGAFFALCASLGQAGGAVISRKAYHVATLAGDHIDGGTAAYQRMIGGILVAGAFALITRRYGRGMNRGPEMEPPRRGPGARKFAWLYVTLNAAAGPTLGVACSNGRSPSRRAASCSPSSPPRRW